MLQSGSRITSQLHRSRHGIWSCMQMSAEAQNGTSSAVVMKPWHRSVDNEKGIILCDFTNWKLWKNEAQQTERWNKKSFKALCPGLTEWKGSKHLCSCIQVGGRGPETLLGQRDSQSELRWISLHGTYYPWHGNKTIHGSGWSIEKTPFFVSGHVCRYIFSLLPAALLF